MGDIYVAFIIDKLCYTIEHFLHRCCSPPQAARPQTAQGERASSLQRRSCISGFFLLLFFFYSLIGFGGLAAFFQSDRLCRSIGVK